MARRFGKSQSWVSNLELGEHLISVELFIQWATICGQVPTLSAEETQPQVPPDTFGLLARRIGAPAVNQLVADLVSLPETYLTALLRLCRVAEYVPEGIFISTISGWQQYAEAQRRKNA